MTNLTTVFTNHLDLIKNAPSKTSRNFKWNGTKYAISLSSVDSDGNREITIWVKSGRLSGKAYQMGTVNVVDGIVTSYDSDLFAAYDSGKLAGLVTGLEAIVERDLVVA